MKETKVICPVCGTEIAIAEHTHIVKNAVVIGKDSNLGTVVLPAAKEGQASVAAPVSGKSTGLPNKAEDRLEALKKAGIDTANLFAMRGASGEGMLVRLVNGVPQMVDNNDPIFRAIIAAGTIPDRRLFRRWVMSQMFHMLTYKGYRGSDGYTAALHAKGYEYQWSMTLEELRVQAKLAKNDAENFNERNRWFDKRVCIALIDDYYQKLQKHVASLKVKHCKGVPYVSIHHRNIFVADIEVKLYRPLICARQGVIGAKTPDQLFRAMSKYNALRDTLSWDTPQCREWVDAFKGSGAFFTLKNLILFHNCVLRDAYGRKMSKDKSLEFLTRASVEYKNEGWRLLAMLKKAINDNGINIEAKMKEWSNAKRNR